MPSLIALGCVEVGEKFRVGSFPLQKQHYTNLKLGWVVVRLGRAVTKVFTNIYANSRRYF